MREGPGTREDAITKRKDHIWAERNAFGKAGCGWGQAAGHDVSHAEQAVRSRLSAVLVRVGPSGIRVLAADTELMSRRSGQRRDA